MRILLTAITALLLAQPASATDLMVGAYLNSNNRSEHDTYLKGVESGLSWANAKLLTERKSPLYCQPMDKHIDIEEIRSIVDHELSTTRRSAKFSAMEDKDLPVGMFLMIGLVKKYPCGNKI